MADKPLATRNDDEDQQTDQKPRIRLWIVIDINVREAVKMLEPDSPWHKWHSESKGTEEEARDMYRYLGKNGHTINAKMRMVIDGEIPAHDNVRQIALPLAVYDEEGDYYNPGYSKELGVIGRIEAQAEVIRRRKIVMQQPELKRRTYKPHPDYG